MIDQADDIHPRHFLCDERKRVEEELHRLYNELEQRVADRTTELTHIFVHRELRMVELKEKIKELEPDRYGSVDADHGGRS